MKTMLLSLLASALVLPSAFSQTLLHVDFSDGAPGQVPPGATLSATANGRIIIVGGESNPADPFGPTGNKSMLIEKGDNTLTPPTARWNFTSTEAGEISFTVYAAPQGSFTKATGIVYLYEGNSIGSAVTINTNGSISLLGRLTETGANTSITLSQTYTQGVAATFKVVFSDLTFSVYKDEVLLETSGGQSSFYFRSGVEAFDNIRFAQASTTDSNARFYVNEFTVQAIPEPSSTAMLGLMGVTAGLVWQLKVRRK